MSNKLIKPAWNETLIFLAGMAEEKDIIILVEELSKKRFVTNWDDVDALTEENVNYNHNISSSDSEFMKKLNLNHQIYHSVLKKSIDELNLVYKLIIAGNLSLELFPRLFAAAKTLINFGFPASGLEGTVQTYIFKYFSPEEKEQFISNVMNDESCGDGLPPKPNKGFKFDLEGTQLILKYLSQEEEHFLNPPCRTWTELTPAETIVKYLVNDKERRDLWFEYLNTNYPNRKFAAEILAELGDARIQKNRHGKFN